MCIREKTGFDLCFRWLSEGALLLQQCGYRLHSCPRTTVSAHRDAHAAYCLCATTRIRRAAAGAVRGRWTGERPAVRKRFCCYLEWLPPLPGSPCDEDARWRRRCV